MKKLAIFFFTLLIVSTLSAATIRVNGLIEGGAQSLEFRGSTMDYYKFAVTERGDVRIDLKLGGTALLASFIGREDEFALVAQPYILTLPDCPNPSGCPLPFLLKDLSAGEYVLVITGGGRSSYDIFDGYVPVNREGGGFFQSPYQYDITGPVAGLEHWDGHLDGTFTVTAIPEPSSLLLTCLTIPILFRRKRRTA